MTISQNWDSVTTEKSYRSLSYTIELKLQHSDFKHLNISETAATINWRKLLTTKQMCIIYSTKNVLLLS